MQVGLLMAHASAMGLAVIILRAALYRWRLPRTDWRMWSVTLIAWAVPSLTLQLTIGPVWRPRLSASGCHPGGDRLAATAGRLAARYRHGSQAFRLMLLTLPLIAPAFAFYPTVVQLARDAKEEFVETSYAPQVRNLRQNVQMQVQQSLGRSTRFPDLVDLITTRAAPTSPVHRSGVPGLAEHRAGQYPITSSVELYGPDGKLVSRFAFNLPEDLTAPPTSEERSCEWDLYEEVAPFFAEERRILHAGRAFCSSDPERNPARLHRRPRTARRLRQPAVHLLPESVRRARCCQPIRSQRRRADRP